MGFKNQSKDPSDLQVIWHGFIKPAVIGFAWFLSTLMLFCLPITIGFWSGMTWLAAVGVIPVVFGVIAAFGMIVPENRKIMFSLPRLLFQDTKNIIQTHWRKTKSDLNHKTNLD